MTVLEPAAPSLNHVALLQGTKAYGVHIRPRLPQSVDVDLLARAITWARESEVAHNEAFNVTNRDAFSWACDRRSAGQPSRLDNCDAAPQLRPRFFRSRIGFIEICNWN